MESVLPTYAEGERTKYKAHIRWWARTIASTYGKDPEAADAAISREWMNNYVAYLKTSSTHPTRQDRRFPNTSQSSNCWTAVNEYMLCVEKRGSEDNLCVQRGRDYLTLCPSKWIQTWKDQIESGKSMAVGTTFVEEQNGE